MCESCKAKWEPSTQKILSGISSQNSGKKQRCCLVLPGFMMKKKKEIDLLTKTLLSKISNRSKNFKKLVETTNICVVFQNEKN